MKKTSGFTLVELIVVMVIVGILAGTMAIFFVPAVQNYAAVGRRAVLTDMADGVMRTMSRDIRSAVPNSIRQPNNSCFELVPTSAGGRFRSGPDTVWDAGTPANPTMPVNTATTTAVFDVITLISPAPAAGDWIVVDNQNTDDVYNGVNRAAVQGVGFAPGATGAHRITLATPFQFPPGQASARFVVVRNAQQAVFHVCSNPGISTDGQNNGTGTLYRFSPYPFSGSAATCPTPAASTPVLATHVESCTITYNPTPGAAQASGYVQIDLKLTDRGESVRIQFGTHTDNVP
ncbi:prepilin-type N-terminal cleavage/methylation domain-containing protein [Pseudoduganella namucuonensis]|uniref:MSHA biogenesis protein MshO n=1 Tax=Pseudoduganella namucuonensis TaxID=1035707 RepID=A0A1I7L5N2_9BURK|nr:prepilin-type N-terminal cleavage/methylation domain-containing protein [Pseudoduganella namucuonensis]SFV05082.1 MSHA biogenesis protein MshO [Pseudoduganella namucuonensis]